MHIEELQDLYASTNITVVFKPRIAWFGHAARMPGRGYGGET
jgi:putative transposon-encoded protein